MGYVHGLSMDLTDQENMFVLIINSLVREPEKNKRGY
jgi:hypothetical protein